MILNENMKHIIEQNFIPNANAILIFILILSGNYLDDFFPCKVQDLMRNETFSWVYDSVFFNNTYYS